MSEPKPSAGLQLFPPPPKKAKPARKSSLRRQALAEPESAVTSNSSSFPLSGQEEQYAGRSQQDSGGRSTPQERGPQSPQDFGRQSPSPITVPGPSYQAQAPYYQAPPWEQPRSHTSFSEAPTLVRTNSNSSHNSTAKRPLHDSPPREPTMLRSIFPRYNPEIPLEHQPYFPTQASPTHIPLTAVSRRPYSPSLSDSRRSPAQSPMAIGNSPGRFPRGISDEPAMVISSVDEVKELWKVVNGWRVSNSEGRMFCLKLTSAAEEPVHTLSCATQPFYTLRLDPTSTSAQMTMTRQDPHKVPKEPSKLSLSSKPPSGIEVLQTTLEETARRLPPNDGLVALLYPRAASNMVIDLANKATPRADIDLVVAAAERECARLVWDEDTRKYYLVHPALVTPFIVSIHSSPAWSRVEYTLEHSEMPRNLIRLVKDGAGGGFIEIDTAVASRIDCFYVVDVAVCAILLVAAAEEKEHNIERFEAPPSLAPQSPKSPKSIKSPILGMGKLGKKSRKEKEKDKDLKIEEFEMDLESQDSLKDQKKREKQKEKDEKIPGFFGLVWMLLRCLIWIVTIFFKGIAKVLIGLGRCLTRKKSTS